MGGDDIHAKAAYPDSTSIKIKKAEIIRISRFFFVY